MTEPAKKPDRILTVMEGRSENIRLVEGLRKAAFNHGWKFCHLKKINSDLIARFDFSKVPLDFVVFRELSGNEYYEVERIMDWLRLNHKIGLNLNVAGGRTSTSDKHYQQGLFMLDPFLKEYAVPTFEAKTKTNVLSYVGANRVHYPFVIKPRRGTTGDDITLVRTESDLDIIPNFKNMLIEQYIEPECDFRVFVIGGVAVGTMRKTGDFSDPGNFKLWCAGKEKATETNSEALDVLSEIATRAAAISGLEYAGIDIIKEANTGRYYLLETNIAAGWSNFVPTTQIIIPELILDWFEDMSERESKPAHEIVSSYVDRRKDCLPVRIKQDYEAILEGKDGVLESYQNTFDNYPNKYLYDAGSIFNKMKDAYNDILSHPENVMSYKILVQEIESMPLSWAGNFIGPNVGTMHDGAILSALYLFLLHKTEEM